MSAYFVTFEATRLSPTSVTPVVRNFGISAGDDFTLRIKVYAEDGDDVPVNVAGATGALTLWQQGDDRPDLSIAGIVASPSTAGNVDFYFAPQYTIDMVGRYLWQARIDLPSGSVVARGSVNIRETMQAVDAVEVPVPPTPGPEPTPAADIVANDFLPEGSYRRNDVEVREQPALPDATGLRPAMHLRRFAAVAAPVVALIGDSTGTEVDTVSPVSSMASAIRAKIARDNPGLTFSWVNRAIGGGNWADLDSNSQAALTLPSWYVTGQSWLWNVEQSAPDLVIIALGTNSPTLTTVQRLRSICGKINAWAKRPDIVFVTNASRSVAIDSSAIMPGAQEDRDLAANLVRSFAQFEGYGLLDPHRFLVQARDGYDPVTTYLTKYNGAVGAAMPWTSPVEVVDFSIEFDIDNTGDVFFSSGKLLKIALSRSVNNDVLLYPISGFWTYRVRAAAVDIIPQTVTTAAVSSGPMTIRVSAQRNSLIIDVAGVRIVEAEVIRAGGLFPLKVEYHTPNAAVTAPITVSEFYVSEYADAMPSIQNADVYGVSGGDTGGNGINHLSSVGVAKIVSRAIDAGSFSREEANSGLQIAARLNGFIYPQEGAMARTVDEYAFRRRFRAPDGGIQVQVDQVPLAVEYWRQGGGIAGAGAYMMAWSDANPTAQAVVVAKGTGFVTLGNGAGPLLEARDTGASKMVDAPVIVRGGATDYTTHPGVMAPNLRALWLGIDNRPLVRLSEDVSGDATNAGWRISASSTIAKLQAEGAAANIGVFVAGKGTGNITLGNVANGNMLLVQPSLGASVNVPYIQPGTAGQPADIAMSPANGAPLRLGVGGRINVAGGFARGGKLVRNAASGYGAITIAGTVSRVFIDGASTITSATFTMPPSADLTDGQEISFTASQTVTTLTLNANTSQTLVGAPTTMGATTPFTLCFDSTTGKWTRV